MLYITMSAPELTIRFIAFFMLAKLWTNRTHGVFRKVAGTDKTIALIIRFTGLPSAFNAGYGSCPFQTHGLANMRIQGIRIFIKAQKICNRILSFHNHFAKLTQNFH
jgi:hypothetical protein